MCSQHEENSGDHKTDAKNVEHEVEERDEDQSLSGGIVISGGINDSDGNLQFIFVAIKHAVKEKE